MDAAEMKALGLTAEELAEAGLTMDDLDDGQEDASAKKKKQSRKNLTGNTSSEADVPSHITVNSEDMQDPDMLAELKELGFSSSDDIEEPDQKHDQEPQDDESGDDEAADQDNGTVGITAVSDEKRPRELSPDSRSDLRLQEMAELKTKAIALNRAGKKDEAMVLMRRLKRLQVLHEQGSNSDLLRQGSAIGQRAVDARTRTRANTEDVPNVVAERLQQYTAEAMRLKSSGRIREAKAMLPAIHAIRAVKVKADQGLLSSADLDSLPPNLKDDEGDDKNQEDLEEQDEIEVELPKVRPSGKSLAQADARREVEYDSIEQRLKRQIDRVMEEGKDALRMDKKELARAIMAVKSRTQHELEIVQTARKKGFPVPPVRIQQRKVLGRNIHEHVGSNQLELEVTNAEGLQPPSGWKVCSSYVYYELGYPKDEVQKGSSPVAHKTDDPEFNFKTMLSFPRPKRVSSKFRFIKLSLALFVPRAIFKDISIGTLDIKLGDLVKKSDIQGTYPLRGGRGKITVALRLRNPLDGDDVRVRVVDDIVLAEFESSSPAAPLSPPAQQINRAPSSTGSRADIAASRTAASASAAAAQAVKSTSAAVPAGINAGDWKDPLRADNLCSNDVLEAEIADLTTKIAMSRARKQDVPAQVQQRYNMCNGKRAALVEAVTEETMSLPQYLEILRKDVRRMAALASALESHGRGQEASKIRSWMKIQMAEIKNAEDNL